jgi:hypothetical protein
MATNKVNTIKVHKKALVHLSRGLYRSPASALKELVSNAWDANATSVIINTGYPNFLQLSVQDNGVGFTREQFRDLMEGGIGNSEKRPAEQTLKFHRPTIGRLGIGMLAIAQICGSFTIISKQKDNKGFKARVKLYSLVREGADQDVPSIVKKTEEGIIEEVDIGEYEFEKYEPEYYSYGTTISSNDVHPTFVGSFQQSLQLKEFKDPPLDWMKALKIIQKSTFLKELGDYWRLLWELSVICPVPYTSENALPQKLIIDEQKRLESYNFTVTVDGIKLYKPVVLSKNPNGYTAFKLDEKIQKVFGRDLKYHGYLIVQEGKQLLPDELRGILIRVREVGVGFYDASMLDYRNNEGPRSRWVTGEIFIDEGLDDALNIDRDSFNRFHPSFRAVQQEIHDILKTQIFPKVYKEIDKRSKKKADEKSEEREKHVKTILKKALGTSVTFKHAEETENSHPVNLEMNKDKAIFYVPDASDLDTKKTYRDLAVSILAIYEASQLEKNTESRREKFVALMLELFSKW